MIGGKIPLPFISLTAFWAESTKKQFFSGLDEFNPTKRDSDDDIIDIGIGIVEDSEETEVEAKLNHHKTTTQKVLNYLA